MQAKVVSIQRGINAEAQRRREILAQAELLCWQARLLHQGIPAHSAKVNFLFPLCVFALSFNRIVTAEGKQSSYSHPGQLCA